MRSRGCIRLCLGHVKSFDQDGPRRCALLRADDEARGGPLRELPTFERNTPREKLLHDGRSLSKQTAQTPYTWHLLGNTILVLPGDIAVSLDVREIADEERL